MGISYAFVFYSVRIYKWWGGKKTLPEFFLAKLKSLLLPFAFYSTIIVAIMISNGWLSFVEWVLHGWGSYALWFIPVLFFSQICAKMVIAVKRKPLQLAVFTIFLFAGIFVSYEGIYLPWTLSTVPYATFMLLIGNYLKRVPQSIIQPKIWKFILLFSITAIISHNWRLDMCYNSILPVIPLTIGAVSGTLMVFMLSMFIEKHLQNVTKILIVIGRETYIVVAFSQITIMLFNEYFKFNSLVKYSLLVVVLIIIKYAKDGVNKLFKTKIL